MPIFRVKSVKIYTGQYFFTLTCLWCLWQISGMDMWCLGHQFGTEWDRIIYFAVGWDGRAALDFFWGRAVLKIFKTFRDGAGRLGHSFYMGPGLGQDVQFFWKVSYLVLEMMINGMLCGTQNNQHDVRDTISSHLQLFAGFCDRRRTLVAGNRAFQCSSAILGNKQGLTGRVVR